MCRTGGPRCNGSRKAQTNAATTNTNAISASAGTDPTWGEVPTREHTNALAAAYPADATGWDGSPLNDRDRRMYALRDSGWTGPIDQDGYPDVTSEGTSALRYMAEQRGETNIASGDDRIAVQVGQVGPDAGPPPAVPPVSPAQPGDEPSGPVETLYVVSDNARVGMQAGDVIGDIRFSM
jgi:hypothetical protein